MSRGLLNRTQAAKALRMGLPKFSEFERENPEIIAAAAVKRTYGGKTFFYYRPGPLMAWLYGSQIAPSADSPTSVDGAAASASPSDAAPTQQGAAA